jgi:hypothetical protein
VTVTPLVETDTVSAIYAHVGRMLGHPDVDVELAEPMHDLPRGL